MESNKVTVTPTRPREVLKTAPEAAVEVVWLKARAHTGVVPEVYHHDGDTYTMEWVGKPTNHHSASEACTLLKQLNNIRSYTPGLYNLPTLEANLTQRWDWFQQDNQGRPDIPQEVVEAAQAFLAANQAGEELLHGDFQPKNTARRGIRLTTFDPMPCFGNALFDIGLWVAAKEHKNLEELLTDAFRADIDFPGVEPWVAALRVLNYNPTRSRLVEGELDWIQWVLTRS